MTMHEHDHPSYDPLRRQIEALIRECDASKSEIDRLRAECDRLELRAIHPSWTGGAVLDTTTMARATGYREAIADVAERTGCKTRPDEVSSLHELRDALCNELRRRKSELGHQALDTTATAEVETDPLSALVAAEEAYLRARGWRLVYPHHWRDPEGVGSVPQHHALARQRRRDAEAGL